MIACIAFWNDTPALLARVFASCRDNGVETIIAVDGAFKEYPLSKDQKYYSTDGCLELAERFANVFIPAVEGLTQIDKRNKYVQAVPDGQRFLIIDTDEELLTPIPELPEEYDMFHVKLVQIFKDDFGISIIPRIFRKYSDLKYFGKHSNLSRQLARMNTGTADATLLHSPHDRPADRCKTDGIYMNVREEKKY